MKKDTLNYINGVVEDVILVGEKVGLKSSPIKLATIKLEKVLKCEKQEVLEAISYIELELTNCEPTLWKATRNSYDLKDSILRNGRNALRGLEGVVINPDNPNVMLIPNPITNSYDQVDIIVKKYTTIVKEVVRAEMIQNKKVAKKEVEKKIK